MQTALILARSGVRRLLSWEISQPRATEDFRQCSPAFLWCPAFAVVGNFAAARLTAIEITNSHSLRSCVLTIGGERLVPLICGCVPRDG